MAVIDKSHPLHRSAEDFEAMYEHVRYRAPTLGGANAGCSADVTDSLPSSSATRPKPASPQHQFDNLLDEPEYDRISDFEELESSRLVYIGDPETVRRRAMAADFSEGRLETFVGSPQKELPGTQNQYVSYQVTTKVGAEYIAVVKLHTNIAPRM
jgi:sorting nexin-4